MMVNFELRHSAETNNDEKFCQAIQKGAQIDSFDSCDNTALMKAAAAGHNKILKKLLKYGARINEQNIYGETALVLCSKNKRQDTVEILLDHHHPRADLNLIDQDKRTPLHYAAGMGLTSIIKELVHVGRGRVNLDARDENGYTLALATIQRHINAVHELLEAGSSVTIRDDIFEEEPIYFAGLAKSLILVEMLAKAELKRDSKNKRARKALLWVKGIRDWRQSHER